MEKIVPAALPPRTPATYRKLFTNCFLVSAGTFGGGMVIISILQKKFVEELHWIDREEILDLCAIAQSCPGVMAVNASIIIGYRVGGILGGLVTLLGTILPPMSILSVISLFYVQFRASRLVALLLKGMQAGVAAVMMNTTITLSGGVVRTKDPLSIALLVAAAAAILGFGADIILVLLICGVFGGLRTLAAARAKKEG